mmetsp:Transcript_14057/g.21876  ORF Transcript_14057/g.21876 Transcript_14057/m.21876 type:complete len:119 (-) Transcript_14057:40-396(-)
MQDNRNKALVQKLVAIFATLLSRQISREGDEMMVEVMMSLPHNPPRENCEKLILFLRENEIGANERKNVFSFLSGSIGIWGGGERKHVEYPPLLPLQIQKEKKEDAVVGLESLSTLFQ